MPATNGAQNCKRGETPKGRIAARAALYGSLQRVPRMTGNGASWNGSIGSQNDAGGTC